MGSKRCVVVSYEPVEKKKPWLLFFLVKKIKTKMEEPIIISSSQNRHLLLRLFVFSRGKK